MSCGDCQCHEIGSYEFMRDLGNAPASPDELPIAGSIDLTSACNLRCRHCFIHGAVPTHGELDTVAMINILDRLADSGVLSLLMTGGEVFLRRDFRAIYQHARSKGFLVTLFTNATLADDELANFLTANPPRRIEVTVYGHTEQTYESVTGVRGSYKSFRHGVEQLLARRLPVHFKAMVLKSNLHEFEQIRDWAETLERPFRYDPIVNARLDGSSAPLAERIDAAAAAGLMGSEPEGRKFFADAAAIARTVPRDDRYLRCGAGRKTFHVDARGFIHPCMMLRAHPYDLRQGSVAEWNARMRHIREQESPSEDCLDCEYRLACPTCPAASLLETGQAGRKVEYFCAVCSQRQALTEGQPSGLPS